MLKEINIWNKVETMKGVVNTMNMLAHWGVCALAMYILKLFM